MNNHPGIVVEFVGLPAVGKTRLAAEVNNRLRESRLAVNGATSKQIVIGSDHRDSIGKLTYIRHISDRLFNSPKACYRSYRTIRRSDQPSRTYELRYLLYLAYVSGELKRHRDRTDVFLADQGFFQHLWRIVLTGNDVGQQHLVSLIRDWLPASEPDLFVFVTVDHETRMERAEGRGTDVPPALFDPDHPLIRDDQRAFETVRELIPELAATFSSDPVILEIDNRPEALESNVSRISQQVQRSLESQKSSSDNSGIPLQRRDHP